MMKKLATGLATGLFLAGMLGVAHATPVIWLEVGSGVEYSHMEEYDFQDITLLEGSYDLIFTLEGVAWEDPNTGNGVWEDSGSYQDYFTIEAELDGVVIASTTSSPIDGQNVSFAVSLDVLSSSGGLLDIDAWSTVSGGNSVEKWSLDYAVLSGEFTPEPVPEPTTMLLLGSGLAGLIGNRIRRKKKA